MDFPLTYLTIICICYPLSLRIKIHPRILSGVPPPLRYIHSLIDRITNQSVPFAPLSARRWRKMDNLDSLRTIACRIVYELFISEFGYIIECAWLKKHPRVCLMVDLICNAINYCFIIQSSSNLHQKPFALLLFKSKRSGSPFTLFIQRKKDDSYLPRWVSVLYLNDWGAENECFDNFNEPYRRSNWWSRFYLHKYLCGRNEYFMYFKNRRAIGYHTNNTVIPTFFTFLWIGNT